MAFDHSFVRPHETWKWNMNHMKHNTWNMNLFNHNNNSADDYVQLNSCGYWIRPIRLAKRALKTIQ